MIKFLQCWYQLRIEFIQAKTEFGMKMEAYKTQNELQTIIEAAKIAEDIDNKRTENALKLIKESNK